MTKNNKNYIEIWTILFTVIQISSIIVEMLIIVYKNELPIYLFDFTNIITTNFIIFTLMIIVGAPLFIHYFIKSIKDKIISIIFIWVFVILVIFLVNNEYIWKAIFITFFSCIIVWIVDLETNKKEDDYFRKSILILLVFYNFICINNTFNITNSSSILNGYEQYEICILEKISKPENECHTVKYMNNSYIATHDNYIFKNNDSIYLKKQ